MSRLSDRPSVCFRLLLFVGAFSANGTLQAPVAAQTAEADASGDRSSSIAATDSTVDASRNWTIIFNVNVTQLLQVEAERAMVAAEDQRAFDVDVAMPSSDPTASIPDLRSRLNNIGDKEAVAKAIAVAHKARSQGNAQAAKAVILLEASVTTQVREFVDELIGFFLEIPISDNLSDENRSAAVEAFRGCAVLASLTGRTSEARELLERALVLNPDNADIETRLADIAALKGDTKEAIDRYEKVLYERKTQDAIVEGVVYGNYGNLFADLGKYDRAEQYLFTSATFGERIARTSDPMRKRKGISIQASAMANLASLNLRRSRFDLAEKQLRSSEDLQVLLGNERNLAITLTSLGTLYRIRDDHPKATRAIGKALAIYEKIGSSQGTATALTNLGQTQQLSGQVDAARKSYESSIAIFREVSAPRQEANAMISLGTLELNGGAVTKGMKHLNAALDIGLNLDDKPIQANALSNLGIGSLMSNAPELAERRLLSAVKLEVELGRVDMEATARAQLARAYALQAEIQLAEDQLTLAKKMFERIGLNHKAELVNNMIVQLRGSN